MKIVIIGNGLAGTLAAKALREEDKQAEIEIYAEEKYLYYPRPNLIEFISGSLPHDRLFAFPERWYGQQRIDVRLATPVRRVLPDARQVETTDGQRVAYDALLLANGASSFIPPIRGADKKGVFSLRTLDHALDILERLRDHARAAVIGGGLLGLEVARALKSRGAEVEVVEALPYLLPRQLDPRGGAILKTEMEKRGIRVRVGVATEEILGDDEARGIRFKTGDEIAAETIIIAAGVRPNLKLAQETGLPTDRGVLVNEHLETNKEGIFAAGDGVQYKGLVYGIIPASFEQARTAAANILGHKVKYEGTVPSITLKVVGIHLTSIGQVNPDGREFEELRFERPEEGVYKKVVLKDGAAVGAIWLGTKSGVNGITRAVVQKANIDKWKNELFSETFDFSLL
ncbi:MAG: FAD-dependent oxidoreductase [Candidatus Aminicenantes bacterium]|nr:FAD-dependent oxidoreductase [Candidatus Aminicenantes bacterium]